MATLIPIAVNPTGPGYTQATAADTVSIPGSLSVSGGVLLPTFTPGSVIFAGAAGLLSQDNDKLFFDATNFSLGIGNAAPGVHTLNITQPVKTTGSPNALLVTGGAHTTLTASVEASDVFFNVTRTVQFATGAIADQRAVKIGQPTYGFVGGSTITTAAAVAIAGAPAKGANATITATHALLIEAGAVGATGGNAYGLTVNAPTGATVNYAAQFLANSTTDVPLIVVQNSNDNVDYVQGIHCMVPNYVGDNKHFTGLAIGTTFSARNAGTIGFKSAGAGLTTNYMYFSGHSVDDAMVLDMAGNVGLGWTAPSAHLDIRGVATLNRGLAIQTSLFSYSSTYTDWQGHPTLGLFKSHSNVLGTLATTLTSEQLGAIEFNGVDSNNAFAAAGKITLTQVGAAGVGAWRMPSKMEFTVGSAAGDLILLRILSDSSVVVGLNDCPVGTNTLLHVNSSTSGAGVTTFEQGSADTDAFDLIFRKSRGTVLAPTIVTTGDELGVVQFAGQYHTDVGDWAEGAAVKAHCEGTVGPSGTSRMPGRLTFWTSTDANPSVPTERMRITSAGNVGIAQTVPEARLDLGSGVQYNRLYVYNDGTNIDGFGVLGNEFRCYMDTDVGNTKMTWGRSTNAGVFAEFMRLTYDGKVGIATNAPDYYLTVNPTAAANAVGGLRVASGIHTASTAATEKPQVLLEGGGREWTAGAAITAQRAIKVTAAVAYMTAGSTITDAATVGITGAYIASTNATITRSHALLIESNAVMSGVAVGTAYGLTCNAPTGATNNYAAKIVGGSGAAASVMVVEQAVATTGAVAGITYTGAANTGQTLQTEIRSVLITTASREWAAGALTLQREVHITQPVYSFVGASVVTDAATFAIAGAPNSSTNATLTNSHGVLIQSADVTGAGACTASWGLTVNAMTGATANYAAQFLGGDAGIIVNPGTTPNEGIILDIDAMTGAGLRNSHTVQWVGRSFDTVPNPDEAHKIDWRAYVEPLADNGLTCVFRFDARLDEGGIFNWTKMLRFGYVESDPSLFELGDDDWNLHPAERATGGGGSGRELHINGGDPDGAGAGGKLYLGDSLSRSANVYIGNASATLGFYGDAGTALQNLDADPTPAEIATVLGNLGLVTLV